MRAFAALIDRRGAPGEAERRLLARALERDAGAREIGFASSGGLLLAFTGPPPARDGDALCLADGWLDAGAPGGERELLDRWRIEGEDALLGSLRGDFALLLWDGRRAVLARDHLGLRGAHFHDDGGVVRIAGEAHQVLALLPATPPPDPAALAHWLAVSSAPEGSTLLDGIRSVPPGGLAELGGGVERPRRWWRAEAAPGEHIDLEDAAGALRAALEQAVARRVAPGCAVQLSGGLDSATVGALASRADEHAPRRAYSAVFPDQPTVDESELIGDLAGAYGLEQVAVEVRGGSLLAGSLEYLERFAAPPSSPNLFFWVPLLRAAASDGVTVMLDGEGGDELFGASPYLIADRLARGDVGGALALVRSSPGADKGVDGATVRRWLAAYGAGGLAPAWTHRLARRAGRGGQGYAWFLPHTRQAFTQTGWGGEWKRARGPRWRAHLVHAATRAGSATYDHVRLRAALAGVTPRHPLVDPDVIATVLACDPALAFDARHSRAVLRESMRGLVPETVRLRRTKSSFDAIFHGVLAGADLAPARALLGDPQARVGEWVDLGLVRSHLLDPPPPGPGRPRQWWALAVWRLLTAECWLRHLEDPAQPRATLERLGLREPGLSIR